MRKSTFIFIILSGLASFFNYAVYPALGRILSDGQFVTIATALALFTQLSSFMLSIVALTIGLSKQESERDSQSTVEKLQALLAHLFLVIIAVFLALSPFILDKLHLPVGLLLPIFLMLGLSILMSVISGFLNGQQKLVKLGMALAFSAFLQLVLSVAVGLVTHDGTATLNGMAAGSFIAIVLTYQLYKADKLPRVSSIFDHRLSLYRSKSIRSLVKYTILASLASLAINLLLIIDLLIVNSRQVDAKLYTDLYIVSRIVFFAGMLFVWPFLSNVELYKRRHNRLLFLKLTGLFTVMAAGAMGIMLLFGEQVIGLLLGSHYQATGDITGLALLAITYKFIFLLITTLTLFFMVLRSYWAVTLPLILTTAVASFVLFFSSDTTSAQLVSNLSLISAIALIIGVAGFLRTTRHHIVDK